MLDGKAQPFDSVATSLLGKPIPAIPVDTQWHHLTVTLQGTRQTIRMDDVLVLDAHSALAPSGTVDLSPGYDLENSAIKCAEVDDLSITARSESPARDAN
jgi:hypothetical protein